MKRHGTALLLLFLINLTLSTTCAAASPWLTDLSEARKVAERTNRPILLHFYADWCGPCLQMERKVFPASNVQQQLKNSVVAVKIDTQKQPHLTKRFNVDTLPTDIVLEPSGQEIVQSSGYRSQSEYVGLVMRARTRYEDLLAKRATERLKMERGQPRPSDPVLPELKESLVMLDGYCPVTLWKSRRWQKGSSQFVAEYKGQTYQFLSASMRDDFNDHPERYVPQFLGCDPVIVWETDKAVSGDIKYGAFYDEQLYLFMSEENRRKFKRSPDQFVKTQVVLRVDQIQSVLR